VIKPRPIVFAITGASGAPYAIGLLRALVAAKRPVQLIVSDHGWRLLETESRIADARALQAATGGDAWKDLVTLLDDTDRGAAPASGS
jgi:4-hydroxy-3-polyprenylbenzoate decarboxylase